ncbi:hypothetical protein JCM11491_004840 [Sporobolomyces phaffii]
MLSNLNLSVPLIGLTFQPQSPHASTSRDHGESRPGRTRGRSPSPAPVTDFNPGLAWFPIETSFATSSSRSTSGACSAASSALHRSLLNPETPAFEPLSPPEDSSLIASRTSPSRRKTLELPPSPPDSPPDSTYEPLLSFARPKSKASRGRAPTRSNSDARARSSASTRRARASTIPHRAPPVVSYSPMGSDPSSIPEEDDEDGESNEAVDDDDDRFASLPLLRLRHRLSTSLTLSSYPIADDKVHAVTSLPSERSTSPNPRRRRSFPPGTVWAEQSHYRLYALQRSKADRTSGVGYWKRWEGVDLE